MAMAKTRRRRHALSVKQRIAHGSYTRAHPPNRPQRSTFVHTFSHEVNLRLLTGRLSLTIIVTVVLDIRALVAIHIIPHVVQILPFLAPSNRWNCNSVSLPRVKTRLSRVLNSSILFPPHQNWALGSSCLPPV